MRSVSSPTFITHGRDDSVIAFWHGDKLYVAALEPKRFIWFDDSEHSNYAMLAEEEYFQGIQSFLEFVEEYRRINAE